MPDVSAANPFAAQPTQARSTPSQFSELSSEDFIKIIFTELSNQDPFDPSDSAALLQQLNSIRSIESDLKLMQRLDALVQENQLASAGALIGKFVGGLTDQNNRVAGFVVSVIRQNDEVHLELDNGWVVSMKGVETIIDPEKFDVDGNNGLPPDVIPPDEDGNPADGASNNEDGSGADGDDGSDDLP